MALHALPLVSATCRWAFACATHPSEKAAVLRLHHALPVLGPEAQHGGEVGAAAHGQGEPRLVEAAGVVHVVLRADIVQLDKLWW